MEGNPQFLRFPLHLIQEALSLSRRTIPASAIVGSTRAAGGSAQTLSHALDRDASLNRNRFMTGAKSRRQTIEEAWGANDLAPNQRYELSNLVEGCREVLRDLEHKLDKYQSLGSNWKSPLDRFRWAAEDIAPIRVKLMHNAVYLSAFNASIISRSHSDRMQSSEAKILQKLNELRLEFQDGKRAAPAFSLVTVKNLDKEETWHDIVKELQTKDLDTSSISTNQGYIRNWIDQVMLADEDVDTDQMSVSATEGRLSWTEETVEQRSSKTPTTPATLATDLKSFALDSAQPKRPGSAASHRSKDSTWRPIDQPNLQYVQTLLTRLFSLRYGDCENLIIKRVYSQLNWRDRGYLYRTDVERYCIEALEAAKLSMSHKELMDFVSSSDLNRDGRIDRDEFIQICRKLLDFAKAEEQRLIQTITRNVNLRACKEMRLGREALAEDKAEVLPLPFNYIEMPLSNGEVEYLNTTTGFLSTQRPAQDPRAFSSMAFTAARILVPCLSMASEYMSLKGFADEYLQSCESVLEVASSFRLLEGESGPTELSDLDELLEISHALLSYVPSVIPALYSKLGDIQDTYYWLLRDIQGFASSLWEPDPQKGSRFDRFVPSDLSGLPTWEKLFTKRRAINIEDQARSCEEFAALIQECRELRKIRGTHWEEMDTDRRKALFDMRTAQLKEKQPTSRTKGRITSLGITGLRKRWFRSPHYCLRIIFLSGEEQKTLMTKFRSAKNDIAWDESFSFESDFLDFRLTDANNVDIARGVWKDVGMELSDLANDDMYTKILELDGKAFDNNKGSLVITLREIDTNGIRSTFITRSPFPPGWNWENDGSGRYYFHNAKTSQFLVLSSTTPSTNVDFDINGVDYDMNGQRLPKGWTRGSKATGIRPHYFNTITKATQWSTPLYQGEATSYTPSGIWNVKEAKPNIWDFQFFESGFERNREIESCEIEFENGGLNGRLSLPAGWEAKVRDSDQRLYFVNNKERTTQWDHPLAKSLKDLPPYDGIEWDTDLEGLKLPEGWVRRRTKTSKKMYYVEKSTNKHYWP
ncbi:MAG: hypothetical protein Q9195_003289 [Heterodermia aff. obscurata]